MKIRCFAFRISFISTRFSTRECKYPERGEWILPISLSISLPPFLPSFSSFQPDKRIIRFVKRNLRFFSRIGIQKLLSVSLSFLLLFLLFFETHLIPHTFFFCRFKNYFKLLIDNFYFEKWRILLRGKNINFNSSSLIKNYIDLFDGARVPLFDGITGEERKGDRFSSRKRFWETIFFFHRKIFFDVFSYPGGARRDDQTLHRAFCPALRKAAVNYSEREPRPPRLHLFPFEYSPVNEKPPSCRPPRIAPRPSPL